MVATVHNVITVSTRAGGWLKGMLSARPMGLAANEVGQAAVGERQMP